MPGQQNISKGKGKAVASQAEGQKASRYNTRSRTTRAARENRTLGRASSSSSADQHGESDMLPSPSRTNSDSALGGVGSSSGGLTPETTRESSGSSPGLLDSFTSAVAPLLSSPPLQQSDSPSTRPAGHRALKNTRKNVRKTVRKNTSKKATAAEEQLPSLQQFAQEHFAAQAASGHSSHDERPAWSITQRWLPYPQVGFRNRQRLRQQDQWQAVQQPSNIGAPAYLPAGQFNGVSRPLLSDNRGFPLQNAEAGRIMVESALGTPEYNVFAPHTQHSLRRPSIEASQRHVLQPAQRSPSGFSREDLDDADEFLLSCQLPRTDRYRYVEGIGSGFDNGWVFPPLPPRNREASKHRLGFEFHNWSYRSAQQKLLEELRKKAKESQRRQ